MQTWDDDDDDDDDDDVSTMFTASVAPSVRNSFVTAESTAGASRRNFASASAGEGERTAMAAELIGAQEEGLSAFFRAS